MARFFGISTPLPAAKAEIGRHYAAIMPDERPSDFPQALMDFANAVCTPKGANCQPCPFASHCTAFAAGTVEAFPVKPAKGEGNASGHCLCGARAIWRGLSGSQAG